MITRNLTCRLERLEVEIAPPDDEPALRILVTSPGQPDQIIEAHGDKNAGRLPPTLVVAANQKTATDNGKYQASVRGLGRDALISSELSATAYQ